MKKKIIIIVSAVLVLAIAACGTFLLIPSLRSAVFAGGKDAMVSELGEALGSGDTAKAEAVLKKAEWQQAGNKEYLALLSAKIAEVRDAALEEKRFADAVTLSSFALERDPSEDNSFALAKAYSANGEHDKIPALLDEMAGKYGTDAEKTFGELYRTETRDATCSSDGERVYCSNFSDASYSEVIPATGEHAWDEGVISKDSTCVAAGEKLFTCTVCSLTRTEEILSLKEHTWDDGTVVKAATCVEAGERTVTCTVCGLTQSEEIPASEGHVWDAGTTVKAATCVEAGEFTHKCTICGEEKTEAIPATGIHKWDAGTVIKAATCVEEGSKKTTCTVCHEEKTETLPATGQHDYVTQVIKEVTCTEGGIEKTVCSVCGKSTEETAVPARGHAFGKWQTVKKATASQEGSEQRTCSVCGQKETRKIAKLTPLKELPKESYIGYRYLAKNYPSYVWAYNRIAEESEKMASEISLEGGPAPVKADDIKMIYLCYLYDYPQHFWNAGSYTYTFRDGIAYKVLPNYICTAAEKSTMKAQFDSAVDKMLDGISGSMSEFERELLIHDRIIENASYDSTYSAPYTRTAYGNLIRHTSVCEGYAELFQYLMYKCGIPAANISGMTPQGSHAWTIVWLEGTPYYVDVTWDDPLTKDGTSKLMHDYFNCTTAYMKASGHTVGDIPYTVPNCTATAMNYYEKMGYKPEPLTVDSLTRAADKAFENGDGPKFAVRLNRTYTDKEVAAFFDNKDNMNAVWRYFNRLFGFKSCLITRSLVSNGTVLEISLSEKK